MKDCYLGVDIGSISTKGVIIDDDNNILRGQNFVQIDFQTGLTDKDVNNMKAFLEMSR